MVEWNYFVSLYRNMKKLFLIFSLVVIVFIVALVGASFYMLDFSLAPDAERTDVEKSYRQLTEQYPEVIPWLDSLKANHALRDTFIVMPSGERHHAYFVRRDSSQQMAIVVHGWRDTAIKFFYLARIYHQLLGYNVLMPELHAHGQSEGEAISMGWNDRKDLLYWIEEACEWFHSSDFVIHGSSMGAATIMNTAGEPMPACVKRIRFIEDSGYTSVWDEFAFQLKEMFGLPAFPLLYSTSLLCKLKYGWSFGEASPLKQLQKSSYPMLFIHGDSDLFVPSWMQQPLYEAHMGTKAMWKGKGSDHVKSYKDHPEEFIQQLRSFLNTDILGPK